MESDGRHSKERHRSIDDISATRITAKISLQLTAMTSHPHPRALHDTEE